MDIGMKISNEVVCCKEFCSPETTHVLYGNDNIQRRTLEIFSVEL